MKVPKDSHAAAAVLARDLPAPSTLRDALEHAFAAALDQAVDRLIEALTDQLSQPRAFGAAQAAAYCGVGMTLFLQQCDVGAFKIGGRRMWDRKALDAWIDVLSGAKQDSLDDASALGPARPASVADKLRESRDAKKKNRRPRRGD